MDANRQLGFEDDLRQYWPVRDILADLGVSRVQLMTNNPMKVRWLEELGITVVGRIPVLMRPNIYNEAYLRTKASRMQHLLPMDGDARPLETAPAAAAAAAAASFPSPSSV